MSSKLVVQVVPERLELRLRGVSALAAGTVYAPVVLEGAGGAVAPVLRLFRDETCADAAAWTSEPASPVPHHARLSSFPSLRLDTEAMLGWFSDVRDAKSLPSSGRVWGWLVAVDMGNGSDVGPAVLGASRVPVLLHDFSPVETDPGESWSDVLAGLVSAAVRDLAQSDVLAGLVSAAVRDIAQSDWAETDPSAGGYVRNKPELGALAAKSKVAEADLASALSSKISGKAEKSEMSVVAGTGTATITLKTGTSATVLTQHQSIPAQTQANWNETDTQSAAYIRNKPTIPTPPSAYTSNPAMDGSASAGSSTAYARGDHVHPTDTSRQAALSQTQLSNIAAVPNKLDTSVTDAYSIAVASGHLTVTDSRSGAAYTFAGPVSNPDDVARGEDLPYATGMVMDESEGVHYPFDRVVNSYEAADGDTTLTLDMPQPMPVDQGGRARDFIVDVDNSANTGALGIEFNLLGEDYALAVTDGDNLAEITELAAGERARFYFTETAQRYTPSGAQDPIPVISIQRMTIEVVTSQGGA